MASRSSTSGRWAATSDRWRRRADGALAESYARHRRPRGREGARGGRGRAARPATQLGPPAAHVDRGRAICIFCLFPFYWLINVSLKTARTSRSRTSSRRPDARQLRLDLQERRLHLGAAEQRDRHDGHDDPRADRGLFAPTLRGRASSASSCSWRLILSISTFPPIAIAAPIFKLWTDIRLYDTRSA